MAEVAPPAGAWIETRYDGGANATVLVAPPAGAWVGTLTPSLNPPITLAKSKNETREKWLV